MWLRDQRQFISAGRGGKWSELWRLKGQIETSLILQFSFPCVCLKEWHNEHSAIRLQVLLPTCFHTTMKVMLTDGPHSLRLTDITIVRNTEDKEKKIWTVFEKHLSSYCMNSCFKKIPNNKSEIKSESSNIIHMDVARTQKPIKLKKKHGYAGMFWFKLAIQFHIFFLILCNSQIRFKLETDNCFPTLKSHFCFFTVYYNVLVGLSVITHNIKICKIQKT